MRDNEGLRADVELFQQLLGMNASETQMQSVLTRTSGEPYGGSGHRGAFELSDASVDCSFGLRDRGGHTNGRSTSPMEIRVSEIDSGDNEAVLNDDCYIYDRGVTSM